MCNHSLKRNELNVKLLKKAAGLPRRLWVALLLILASLELSPVLASEVVLQDIKLQRQGNLVLVDIDFGVALLYQKHFPQKFGEILQIQLNLSEQHDRPIHKEVRQANDMQAPADLAGFLIYVTYEEGVPGGPYLTLRFSRPVSFEVRAGSSLENITIAVTDEGGPPTVTAGVDTAEPLETESESASEGRRTTPQAAPDASQVDEMMAKARQTLTFGDASGAIELLRKIIRMPDNQQTQDARELLGLALERSNQIPRAKFEYKKYLQLYEKGEGPDRVRQRLTALQNLGVQPRQKLRRARREEQEEDFRWFGRWSESYSSYFVQYEPKEGKPDPGAFVASRTTSSNLNLRGRYRGSDSNVQTVVSASHLYDFEDRERTDGRISYINAEYEGLKNGLSGVAGRQRVSNSGVFDRFDGLLAGYRLNETTRVHVMAGEPVDFFNSKLDDKKKFWGLKLDLGDTKAKLNGNLYSVSQTVASLSDRQAVGGVIRYTQKELTGFALADYDYGFNELIAANFRLGWQALEKVKFDVSYNYRSELNLSKALAFAGSEVYDITRYLKDGLDAAQIEAIARSRAGAQSNWTVGSTYQVDKDRQLNMDINVFSSKGYGGVPEDVIGTPCNSPDQATNGCNLTYVPSSSTDTAHILKTVPGGAGTSNQYQMNLQWISTNTFVERDLHVIGTQLSWFSTYDQYGIYVNSRLPPYKNWNPRPRLNVYKRTFAAGGSASTTGSMVAIEPSLKVDFRWKRAWVFDIEAGMSYLRYSNPNSANQRNETIRMGYHYTFN